MGEEFAVAVEVMPLDLSDAKARAKLGDRLRTEPIAGLCNSAGFGTSGVFRELPLERESKEVTLNALALMELTYAALDGMVKRGAGAVMNIASIAAFQPLPYMAVYSVRAEVLRSRPRGVARDGRLGDDAVLPGPVPTEWTEIVNAKRFSVLLAQVSPTDVQLYG
ncbi:SDR family NAD(P)-dependent oxidoreductase [Mycobacterium tilburgii]|uniref:SDR family NAD(P)-dependent oxidoreductase n=1 Tax=Mycobacterium tilburgii TaxID=44467 RepID=UPI0021B3E4B4|nr:SDR family NAD(P)-dependent oxidoreductase [Mycobacterium tilburgii]